MLGSFNSFDGLFTDFKATYKMGDENRIRSFKNKGKDTEVSNYLICSLYLHTFFVIKVHKRLLYPRTVKSAVCNVHISVIFLQRPCIDLDFFNKHIVGFVNFIILRSSCRREMKHKLTIITAYTGYPIANKYMIQHSFGQKMKIWGKCHSPCH